MSHFQLRKKRLDCPEVWIGYGQTVEVYYNRDDYARCLTLTKAKDMGLLEFRIGKLESFGHSFGLQIKIKNPRVQILVMNK